jgi:hypothetical protein
MHFRPLASARDAFLVVCVVFPSAVLMQVGTFSDAERIKSAASTYHRSPSTKVVVKMKDGKTHKGHITDVDADLFTIFDPKARREIQIRYDSVSELRRGGLSRSAKTALWIGVGAGIGAMVIFGPKSGGIGQICPLGCPR